MRADGSTEVAGARRGTRVLVAGAGAGGAPRQGGVAAGVGPLDKPNDWVCRDCQYQNTGHTITNCKGRGCKKTTPLHVLRRAGIVPSGQRNGGGGQAARGQAAGKPNTSGTGAAAATGGGAPADLLTRKLRAEVEARKKLEQELAELQAASAAAAAKAARAKAPVPKSCLPESSHKSFLVCSHKISCVCM